MENNQLLKDEVMIKFMMKRFNKTREQVIADMPPEVRKNLNVKENKFLADHLEIIQENRKMTTMEIIDLLPIEIYAMLVFLVVATFGAIYYILTKWED